MYKILLLVFLTFTSLLANKQTYTIAVCATESLENALICKQNIFEKMNGIVFIVKENDKYFTNINIYTNKVEAQKRLNSSSKYVLAQKPYIKKIATDIVRNIDKKKLFIDIDKIRSKQTENPLNIEKQEPISSQDLKPKSVNIPLVSPFPDNLELVRLLPY